MSGVRKSTLAKAALANLNSMHEMAEENRRLEGNAEAHKTLAWQASSAAHAIKTIRAYDESMLPTWLVSNWAYFKTIGWHNDFVAPRR